MNDKRKPFPGHPAPEINCQQCYARYWHFIWCPTLVEPTVGTTTTHAVPAGAVHSTTHNLTGVTAMTDLYFTFGAVAGIAMRLTAICLCAYAAVLLVDAWRTVRGAR